MSALKLFFLGPPRIECEGGVVTPDTRKATALLARLALAGERLPRDLLATFLWPDSDERKAKAALRRTLSDLKATAGEAALVIERDALGIQAEALWCDVLAFQALIAAVEAHKHEDALCGDCIEWLETAVTLYRDDFLAGFSLRDSRPFDDWQLHTAEYLRREFDRILEQLVTVKEAQGAYDEGISYARRWLQLDPLREEAHRHLIKLYAWTGQRSAALKQYRDCVRILEEELGVDPLPETTALYQAVQEDRLEKPAIAAPPRAARPKPSPSPTAATSVPFIGRESELAAMRAIYDEVGPDGRLLALAGEVGIGNTRLAETFLAGLPQAAHLRARCYPGENHFTYAPFVAALREGLRRPDVRSRLDQVSPAPLAEAARLLPELTEQYPDLPEAPPLDWPGASGRFFDGLGRVLEALLQGSQPGVLWLDDLQWADSASLDLLAYLAHRWRGRPYLLLTCWRSSDLSVDHPLPQLLAGARREGSGELITLDRLDAGEVERLVRAYLANDSRIDLGTISAQLYTETEGLPFLVAAYLQSPAAQTAATGRDWVLPPTARDLFHTRLASVAETERQILQTAAVIGRPFDYSLLRAVSGRSEEETVAALEQAVAHLLLVEHMPEQTYDFSHHKLRALVIEEMSLARRRLLHRRVAQALAQEQGTQDEQRAASAASIARHYQEAGQDREAAAYYVQAGDYARSLFAHREALDHYQTALALGHADAADLYEICGDLHVRLGEYSAALNSFERAATLSDTEGLPILEHKIGQVFYRRGEWGLAEYHFRQAEELAAGTAVTELVRVYLDWSYSAYRAGDLEKSQRLVEKAQALSASPMSQAQVHNMLGILERKRGDLPSAIAHFQRSKALAQEHNLLSGEITALNNLALAQTAVGNQQEALLLFENALSLCGRYGDRHWEAALHNNLADLYHQMGRRESAEAEVRKAITILAEIGREAGDWQPEIWKLCEW